MCVVNLCVEGKGRGGGQPFFLWNDNPFTISSVATQLIVCEGGTAIEHGIFHIQVTFWWLLCTIFCHSLANLKVTLRKQTEGYLWWRSKSLLARVNEFVATLFANFSSKLGRENIFLKSFHPKQCFEELPPHRAKRVCEWEDFLPCSACLPPSMILLKRG